MARLTFSIVCAGLLATASLGQPGNFCYSIDIGGDLDVGDPVTPGNNWMDTGDMYFVFNDSPGTAFLLKDDTGPVSFWAYNHTGFPFALPQAPQPYPSLVGLDPGATEADVLLQYSRFWDLDGDDQIFLPVANPTLPVTLEQFTHAELCERYICVEPQRMFYSTDDDGSPGWYKSGDVPTTALPDNNDLEIWSARGPFNSLGARPPIGISGEPGPRADESYLDLAPVPTPTLFDDDVDALDFHTPEADGIQQGFHRYWYYSPDHEANLGLDPGSIYITDLWAPGQNCALSLDQQTNIGLLDDPTTLDMLEDADVDAFEFTSVMKSTFEDLFGYDPDAMLDPDDTVLVLLFSVDQDDPDTATIDESGGGLNPAMVYVSDLVGHYVELADYSEWVLDIDAIAVSPEPTSLSLLVLGGLALLRRRTARP